MQLLHRIENISSMVHEDLKKWKDLEEVYSEIEREFINLYSHHYQESTMLTRELPLSIVDTKRPGWPCYHITKEVMVELRGLNFSCCKISHV